MKYSIRFLIDLLHWKLILLISYLLSVKIFLPKMVSINNKIDKSNIRHYIFQPYKINKISSQKGNIFTKRPKARSGHRIVCTDSNLYCYGGYNPDRLRAMHRRPPYLLQELWKYNFITQKWKLCFGPDSKDIPKESASSAMIIKSDKLIIFGGTGFPFGEDCSNKCHIIDIETRPPSITRIDACGDPPTPLYGPAIVLHENYLYTIGGTTGYDYSCDIYRLDLRTKEWECVYICKPDIEDAPVGRYRHEIVYDGHFIYVLGGGTFDTAFDLVTIPAFDLILKKWRFIKTIPDPSIKKMDGYPEPRSCYSCVQYETENGIEAVIAGGCCVGEYFDDIWKLNFRTFQWSMFKTAKLNAPSYFHDAATSGNGCMYIFGGIQVQEQKTRTCNLYKMWVNIPKLSEISWDAINHYNPQLSKYSREDLLRFGVPEKFVNRIPKPNDD